jgi:hypothetical protein
MSSTQLDVRPGLPFSRRVRLTDGKNIWADLDDFEARMHIRVSEDSSSRLKYDFTPHLGTSFDNDDILVEWALTGAETSLLKLGYYDLVISDTGVEDARAIRVLYGKFNLLPGTTTSGGTA